MVLEKTLESPLDCKEIKPVNLTGNQSWIFIGRTDPEAEAPMLWPPDVKIILEALFCINKEKIFHCFIEGKRIKWDGIRSV